MPRVNFQDAEILNAAKAGYEQAVLHANEMPEDSHSWQAQPASVKDNWAKITLAILQAVGFNRPTKDPHANVPGPRRQPRR